MCHITLWAYNWSIPRDWLIPCYLWLNKILHSAVYSVNLSGLMDCIWPIMLSWCCLSLPLLENSDCVMVVIVCDHSNHGSYISVRLFSTKYKSALCRNSLGQTRIFILRKWKHKKLISKQQDVPILAKLPAMAKPPPGRPLGPGEISKKDINTNKDNSNNKDDNDDKIIGNV